MNETRNEVDRRVSRLGENEWRLAYSKAENKSDASEIVQLIEDHRKPFQEGKVANLGSALFARPAVWEAIAAESDNAAKCILLRDSAQLAELERLEKIARAAQEAAEAKSRQLQADWEEYNTAPARIEALNVRLAEIGNSIRDLDEEGLKTQYRDLYSAILNGGRADQFALVFLTETIASRNLRVECLTQLSEQLQSELADLKKRSKVLAARLGMKAN